MGVIWLKKKFFNAVGITLLAIIIMGSLIVVNVQGNEQDPPGLATIGNSTSQLPTTLKG
jgi:hypothetical protein